MNIELEQFTKEYIKELGNSKKAIKMMYNIVNWVKDCKRIKIIETTHLDDSVTVKRREWFKPFPDVLGGNPAMKKVAKRHGFKTNKEFCIWVYEQRGENNGY